MIQPSTGPHLPDLPHSDGRAGWPWTIDAPTDAGATARPTVWPRLTIVTPSLNQAAYLEETIRSVLLQGYPNLEYLVIDGGSTDGSVQIIQKYEKWLTGWRSAPDSGQSQAINDGFRQSTGEWMAWMNSDDCYAPGALLSLVAQGMARDADLVIGQSVHFGARLARPVKRSVLPAAVAPNIYARTGSIIQPTVVWRRHLFETCGPLAEDLHYTMDWEFFIKCSERARIAFCDRVVALVRVHDLQKSASGSQRRWEEIYDIHHRYLPKSESEALERARGVITFIRDSVGRAARGRGPTALAARLLRGLFLVSGLYKLWRVPDETWVMHEALHIPLPKLVRDEYGSRRIVSAAEAVRIHEWRV